MSRLDFIVGMGLDNSFLSLSCQLIFTIFYISYLGTATNETIAKFNDIIIGLNAFEFGSFDEFVKIQDVNITDLNHINLTKLYKRVCTMMRHKRFSRDDIFLL